MVGRFGGSSAGFVVAALNAASAKSREVVVLRVLSADILCPRATWAEPSAGLLVYDLDSPSAITLAQYGLRRGPVLAKLGFFQWAARNFPA